MLKTLQRIIGVEAIDLLKVVTPSNHLTAKEAWLQEAEKGHFTNPIFTYNDREEEARKAILELERIENSIPNPKNAREEFVRELAVELIGKQRLTNAIAIAIAQGDEGLTNGYLHDYHGRTNDDIIAKAYAIAAGETVTFPSLDNMPRRLTEEATEKASKTMLNAEDLKIMFCSVLEDYKLNDIWSVEISDSYSAVTVKTYSEDGKSKIFIPTNKECSVIAALKLVAHEIEAHARHNMNCAFALEDYFDIPHSIACRLVSDRDATLTEGFAKIGDAFIERKCTGKITGTPKPWYVIAADLANKGESFAKITERLHTEYGIKLETCWTTTIRIFRGCRNTANEHNYSREADRCYLEGFLVASKLFEENSPLFDYAKFDEKTFNAARRIVGSAIDEPRFPHIGVAEMLVNNL
jgi:hypothetical protein